MHRAITVLAAIALACLIPLASLAAQPRLKGKPAAAKPAPKASIGARPRSEPLKEVEAVVFAVRCAYDDPHWYANIGYYCDDEHHKARAAGGRPDDGKLLRLDLRSGKVRTLVDARGGSIRDPQVHYDGRTIVFSYRKAGEDSYHLWEIQSDGAGLRQITSGPFDDYEPAWLPDGGIVFVSTRCKCWVNCWMTQVGVLYRCDADGSNLRRLSYSGEHDNTPWVLPDGRVLYTRWEYVDRSQVEFHHLWAMNPDGTAQTVFYGNMHPGTVMIDAKPVPGSREVLVNFSPGHGVTDHKGIATLVSPESGPDCRPAARPLHRGALIEDPYPLSDDCLLAARGKQIIVMDGSGNSEPIYTYQGEGDVREPRPLVARPREPVIPSRVEPAKPTGRMVLADVYRGRQMEGVRRGEIKKLLVLESLPKQVNFSGGPDLVSWLGTFTLERVLGTVPVEADGSAALEVPAGRPVFFVALDAKDLSVQRMHSFTSVMPGETAGCAGCHEPRTDAPEARTADLAALRRPPSRIEPFAGQPDVLDFVRDIQPVLDRHCVRCHNYAKRDGGVALVGDLGPTWSHSYYTLLARLQVADGRNGLGHYPPRTIGSSASPLLKMLEPAHYGVKVASREWRTVWMWIESGAPYAGSYAGLRNAEQQQTGAGPFARLAEEAGDVLRRRCNECHALGARKQEKGHPIPFEPITGGNRRGVDRRTGVFERVVLENDPIAKFSLNILLNFTRPADSPLLLGPLAKKAGGFESCGAVFKDTGDPDYHRLLEAIGHGKAELDAEPRYGTPGFKPNRQYVREMKRFGILPESFDVAKDPIDIFQTDQAYWKSLWPRPEAEPQ